MSYPVNYSFVYPTTVNVVGDDGQTQKLDVLALNTPENDRYWKKIYSFHDTITRASGEGHSPTAWHVSPAFVDLAVQDIMEQDMTILDIPVKPIVSETATCMLEMTDGTKMENTYWQ